MNNRPKCHKPECGHFAEFIFEADPYHRRPRHPSLKRWVGLMACEHHADVARRLDERYAIGLLVRRVGQASVRSVE